jgi:HEPN domain-containing protein
MTVKLPELWLQYASDDLKSAKVLLAEEVYNITCFHAQQTVEKLFKAFIAAYDQPIPRTHNLIRLNKICEDLYGDKLEFDNDKLILLNDVYIDSRYPADFGVLPSGQPGEQEANTAYSHAKDIDTILRPLVGERINIGSMPKDDS